MNKSGIFSNIDLGLIVPVVVLVFFSLTTLFSINFVFFRSQLIFLTISLFAFIFFSNVNPHILKFYSTSIYVISVIFLLFVLILGIESRGATRWIEIFGFQIQLSEIIKPFLILSISSFLAKKDLSFKTFFLTFLLLIPIIFLIYKQPDLGNALIFFVVTILTLLFCGFPIWWFAFGFSIFAALIPFLWHILHDYQKQRVLTFLYPGKDPLGASYNAIQSVVAVGSGMLFGKGLGQGTQSGLRFLPERHTDFIFATLSEELGFLGSTILILAMALLLYKIYTISRDSEDKFSKIFCATSFFLILTQAVFNIGMNIGILPIVGVTLPFVSAGGSSILSSFILLGMISSIRRSQRNKNILEIK